MTGRALPPDKIGWCGHELTIRQIGFELDAEMFTYTCDQCPRPITVLDPQIYILAGEMLQQARPSWEDWAHGRTRPIRYV